MNARLRRLASDYEQVKKDFAGHKYIVVTPIGSEPPERYHVTYFVNGYYLDQNGKPQILNRHEVEITLHAEYPRYKPICKILTPIWHPNFRDGQICIGDIWGAGESLSDIIVNIGDMIQYKSWNSFSPLSSDAAEWAIKNKNLFPVGTAELHVADYASAKDTVDIDLFDENGEKQEDADSNDGNAVSEEAKEDSPANADENSEEDVEEAQTEVVEEKAVENDFEITAEELEGVTFIPASERMQSVNANRMVQGKKVNFKTVFTKGLIWALIGAILGFAITELGSLIVPNNVVGAYITGNAALGDYFRYSEEAEKASSKVMKEYKAWCKNNGVNPDSEDGLLKWKNAGMSKSAQNNLDDYLRYDDMANDALYDAYSSRYGGSEDRLERGVKASVRGSTAIWSGFIALFIGLFLGIGEGVYYGSANKAIIYALIGSAISLVLGSISGFIAQLLYSEMLGPDPGLFTSSLVRALGWGIMGIGIGLAIGLIKPEIKRVLFCSLGGLIGAFVGGFAFNYITKLVPNDVIARGAGIILMGLLIGLGVGLLEQFAKSAWLKVIRGEFEGKEYLVFSGTTSIGNNGKNTIVLFKDKLVGPHHCDIRLEGSKYVLYDCGTPMGTIVNGQRISKHLLRQGDAIAIGNSVLIFNTK